MTKIQSGNKRVESSLVACLDPSSILGDSTDFIINKATRMSGFVVIILSLQREMGFKLFGYVLF